MCWIKLDCFAYLIFGTPGCVKEEVMIKSHDHRNKIKQQIIGFKGFPNVIYAKCVELNLTPLLISFLGLPVVSKKKKLFNGYHKTNHKGENIK